MKLHDLRPAEGSTKKRKRVGRGTGSGKGKTSGRGQKGQNARSGGSVRLNFEGGQLPLTKRLPKLRGFNNRFKVIFVPVNLDQLDRLFEAQAEVSPETLARVGLLGNVNEPVVVLARGEVTKPLTVRVQRISAAARQKIEAAGGTVEVLGYEVNRRLPRS
ncbi:MAG: 50S ribosomal protein L15 [Caldilinea sp.]|nr:50S ribosomal protein L15 [Caldilinea sp.]MDW8439005.1 50S ribosomal protein L15 [Caldilineaceae bacterium]